MQHYNILIATPGSKLEAEYVKSLTDTLTECQARGLTYKWLNEQGSLVHNTREATLTGSMQLNPNDKGPLHDTVSYDKIIWIDSDISWSVKDFFRLYESDKDIITGAYLLADGVTSSVHSLESGGAPYTKGKILGIQKMCKIHSAGFGFIAMKSGVFENIRRPWFELLPQQIGPNMTASLGEDLSWCLKATQSGYDIYFDPRILVGHMKTKRVGWK
jgi:hypothetical protein